MKQSKYYNKNIYVGVKTAENIEFITEMTGETGITRIVSAAIRCYVEQLRIQNQLKGE